MASAAEKVFGDEKARSRSTFEYMRIHGLRLIGSRRLHRPREGGQLTERVRRRPYAWCYFDAVEKAHPDGELLLQLLRRAASPTAGAAGRFPQHRGDPDSNLASTRPNRGGLASRMSQRRRTRPAARPLINAAKQIFKP